MNYIINKFRASMDVEQGNKTVYIYTNSKALCCAKKITTGQFINLSNAKENALRNDIMAMLEAEAKLIINDEVEDLIDPTAVHQLMQGAM